LGKIHIINVLFSFVRHQQGARCASPQEFVFSFFFQLLLLACRYILLNTVLLLTTAAVILLSEKEETTSFCTVSTSTDGLLGAPALVLRTLKIGIFALSRSALQDKKQKTSRE
jgi:hypothetical protein